MKNNNGNDLILIVEDDEAIIEILKFYLNDKGFNVATAENGRAGLDIIEKEKVSLVLCDIMMPVMDGYQTLENIRLLFNPLELPVIMMTAKTKEEDIVRAFEIGANDYITKPFNFHVLNSRINNHLTSKNINSKYIKQNNQLKKMTERLEKILDSAINFVGFTQSLNYLNKNKLYGNLKKLLPAMFNIEYFSLFIYDKNRRQLELAVHNHTEWENLSQPFVVNEENGGLMWDTIKARKMIRLENFSESKYSNSNNQDSRKKYAENTICMPLVIDDRIIGVLNLNNFQDENMTSDHLANIRMVTNHIAMAFHNLLLHKQIEEHAIKDELTNLYNRRYMFISLNENMEEARRYKKHLSVLMFDLDYFKKVNDTYGHDNGDITLKAVSECVSGLLRKTDILCRYGGEEFVAVLTHTSIENALIIAERIRKEIEKKTIRLSCGNNINVTVSIGVTAFTENDDVDSLLKRADNCMYEAKNNGRNNVISL